jgi:CBS-domain-containing membrane protein
MCLLLCCLQVFVLLGLRHLIVVDAQNRIVGICTRKDLDHAAGHGWWRMSAQAPKPSRHSKRPAPFNRCACVCASSVA